MSHWEGEVVLKGLLFDNSHFWMMQELVELYSGDDFEIEGHSLVTRWRDSSHSLLRTYGDQSSEIVEFYLGDGLGSSS